MTYANVTAAKAQLSKYISEVEKGKEVVITKAGKPTALLTPYYSKKSARKIGALKGKIKISADFDATPKKMIDSFYT